jgi:hypothetical protein
LKSRQKGGKLTPEFNRRPWIILSWFRFPLEETASSFLEGSAIKPFLGMEK